MRPAFIVSAPAVEEKPFHYPNSDEPVGRRRALSRAAGMEILGINLVRLQPGERSSWPHAEADEEEFAYVIEGAVECWIDGHLHPLKPGDFVGFPKATGISHCFINNSAQDAVLLVGGEASKPEGRVYYPFHPHRKTDIGDACWWDPPAKAALGPHDGLPDRLRSQPARKTSSA